MLKINNLCFKRQHLQWFYTPSQKSHPLVKLNARTATANASVQINADPFSTYIWEMNYMYK